MSSQRYHAAKFWSENSSGTKAAVTLTFRHELSRAGYFLRRSLRRILCKTAHFEGHSGFTIKHLDVRRLIDAE